MPAEFLESKTKKILYDSGKGWGHLSTLGFFSFRPIKNVRIPNYDVYSKPPKIEEDSSYFHLRFGAFTNGSDKIAFSYYYFTRNNLFSYLYPRIVSNVNAFSRFTGIAQDNSRGGFIAGEVDQICRLSKRTYFKLLEEESIGLPAMILQLSGENSPFMIILCLVLISKK